MLRSIFFTIGIVATCAAQQVFGSVLQPPEYATLLAIEWAVLMAVLMWLTGERHSPSRGGERI